MTGTDTRSDAYVVMRRMFDEGFATGDGAVVDELCSPELVEHQFRAGGAPAGVLQHVVGAHLREADAGEVVDRRQLRGGPCRRHDEVRAVDHIDRSGPPRDRGKT